ncbi:LOW QUALITY PROTEIN: uncharacterized protein EMH_0027730 [Eimeria mitis]|uniref:Uncharacterized protein n=1 Tax=Eimeria mitis TaxID=44415 RepID=U6KCE1_9EIME|nr:LOW QUALITY PROTEIN: uncharacterized protein EMH_0027730 [Eimeria mitis]CDJ35624.1 hypothetical protein, conserved [Eimeria mitis]
MAARKFPPESTEDHRCPKSGDCSVETGLDLKPIEDAKASHMTEGDDWFPASQWPSSGSNSGNSTVRCGSYMQPQTHVPPVNLVTPATSSANTRELFRGSLRQGDYLSAQEQVGCDVALESVLGIPEDGGGTSAALSLEGTGSPKTSTIASSLGVDGVTVGRSQLPQHSSGSPTNRNGTKTSLVCGPLSVQQTLTERQLDIDKRMQEVRQQNRRRLHRRQQEAKEQQLQRIKEQREALLARRERIKLASLWKERGMAAAARPSTVSKGQKKIERLPSDASHPTEDDSRSADDLLAALVISESISLQTELGSTGEAASAELAKIESRSPSHIHCRLRLPNERNVSKGPPTAQPTVSVSSSYQQYKTLPLDIGRNRARQPTDEPKTSSVGMSVSEVGSSKSTEQTNGTLPNTLLSCQFQNSLNSSQRVGYLGRQLQGMPAVPYSSGGSLHPHERAFPLALRRLAKPQMKEAAAEKAKRTFFQRGGHQTCTLLSYEEGEHKKHMQFKSRSAVVVADQQLKKQVDVQLQQHQHHSVSISCICTK